MKTRVFMRNTCIYEKHVYLWKTRVFMRNTCIYGKHVYLWKTRVLKTRVLTL